MKKLFFLLLVPLAIVPLTLALLITLAIAPLTLAKKFEIRWPYAIATLIIIAILGAFTVQAVHPEWLQ